MRTPYLSMLRRHAAKARVRPSGVCQGMDSASQFQDSASSREEDEEKISMYKKWIEFPTVSHSLISHIIGVVMSNTVHVFFTERQLCLPDRLVTTETLDRTIASLLSRCDNVHIACQGAAMYTLPGKMRRCTQSSHCDRQA